MMTTPLNAQIIGYEGIHSDIVPVLVEMLRNAGFDASTNFSPDATQNMADGVPGFYMFGCAFHYVSHEMRDVIIVK